MDVVYERCCGVDVHKASMVACLIVPGLQGRPRKEVRTFGTMTDDLLALIDWLRAVGCTQVAMESTGVFWKPLFNLIESTEGLAALVVNAQHITRVPGRKTDVRDCEWIADLLRHGPLRPSFISPRPQRELRELTRYRTALIGERTAEVNRIQKVLEGANIKLASVTQDILGASGCAMLRALVAGETAAADLADLARGTLRSKIAQLERALAGQFGPHQRFLVAQQLAHVDALDEIIERVNTEIAERLRPVAHEIALLDSIPGVGQRTAEVLVAENGVDMGRFGSAEQLAAWAGMVPGNNVSAGKRRGGKTCKGSPWLRQALVEAAHGAGRSKKTYLGAQFRRLLVRKGKKRAAVAVGHSILVIAYHVPHDRQPYQDLGPDYYEQRNRQIVERRLVHRLAMLGYGVTLHPTVPAA